MSKKNLKELKEYFRDIYPHIWEHYKFLYDRRINDTNKRFEFLLLLDTLFVIIFFSILREITEKGTLFYIPLFFLISSIVLFFFHITPKKIWFPWFEKENLKEVWESKNNKDFYEEGIRSIHGVLHHLWRYSQKRKLLYILSLNFLLLAIFSPIAIFLVYKNYLLFSGIISVIIFVLLILINLQFHKEESKKSPVKEIEKFFDDWKKIENSK